MAKLWNGVKVDLDVKVIEDLFSLSEMGDTEVDLAEAQAFVEGDAENVYETVDDFGGFVTTEKLRHERTPLLC